MNSDSRQVLKFSERESYYYAVLKKLFVLKKQGRMSFSAKEVQESISYFKIPIGLVEEFLEEFYNHSIVGRWEFPTGEIKYELSL